MSKLDTTSKTHVLFLDMQEVTDLWNVRMSVVEAEKHPLNPSLPLGDINEWDSRQAAPWEVRTVLYDEQEDIFKAWYGGIDIDYEVHYINGRPKPKKEYSMGYATSRDGVRWHKPNLGLFEFNGNKNNNMCHHSWGAVIKDLSEQDPQKRYKLVRKNRKRNELGKYSHVFLDYSADGIHWEQGPQLGVPGVPEWDGLAPDIIAFIRDEQDPDPQRRYKLVWQTKGESNKHGPRRVRIKHMAWSPDAIHWTACPTNPFFNPNDSTEIENHFLLIFPHRGWYIMLYEYGWYYPRNIARDVSIFENQEFRLNEENAYYWDYGQDIRLAVSRDGVNYTRINSHQQVITRGIPGAWDAGSLIITDKIPIKNNKMYLYYAGSGMEWGGWRSRRGSRVNRMGLATLDLDRFTCLEVCDGDSYGWAYTIPIEVRKPDEAQLVVNVSDTDPNRSWVEFDLLDADTGDAVPGYALDDCARVDEDGISIVAHWKGGATLSGVKVKNVRLRIRLYGRAKLYSFGFKSNKDSA